MRTHYLLAVLLVVAGAACPALQAQTTADSVSVMVALSGSIRGETIAVVANRFGCYHARECASEEVASPSITRMLDVLAASLGARVSAPGPLVLPPACPAADGAPAKGAAYRLHLGVPQLRADSASIVVVRACTRSARARDPILLAGEEFLLERRAGRWEVVQRRFLWRS
jgi:hypothetical protein